MEYFTLILFHLVGKAFLYFNQRTGLYPLSFKTVWKSVWKASMIFYAQILIAGTDEAKHYRK